MAARALAIERVARGIEVEVIAAQLGHMHESVDIQAIECDEKAEMSDAANRARKDFPDAILHEIALEPVFHIASRIVGTSFGHRAMHPKLRPRSTDWVITLAGKTRLNTAMNQQIRVAANRRGKVRVGIVAEPEMADIVGPVHRLLQRSQQHRLQQIEIGPVFDLREQRGIVRRSRIVTPGKRERAAGEELLERG